jgi:ubiquinone/menaquinone biosynthesis C-methylase UbiE
LQLSWQKKEEHVEPYSKLALIYDEVMNHVDYKKWAGYVCKLIDKYHPSAKSLVDISCGTGSFLVQVQKNNRYELFGFDQSYPMVVQAKKKMESHKYPVLCWQGEMNAYAFKNKVDVIVSLYDSVNYLLNSQDVLILLSNTYESLLKDGLIIFDICTETNSLKFFRNYFERDRGTNYKYVRKSDYDKNSRIHSNRFEIKFEGSDVIYIENHKQKIYYLSELINIINSTKFKIEDVYDGFTFNQATEKALRIHFILRKVDNE